MPRYETPEPISVTLELGVGNVRIAASARADTVVEVRPSDDTDESDVKAAQQVRIDYTNGTLRVVGPEGAGFRLLPQDQVGRGDDRPAERLRRVRSSADGRRPLCWSAGESGFKTSAGNLWLERTGPLRLDTSAGHITADGIAGNAEISTGTGKIQIGEVEGSAVVKNSNGDTEIDAVTGDVRVRAANGDIRVDRAGASVDVKTSNGNIRVGEVVRGSVVVGTAMGDLDIGIAQGTAAWLEVNTAFGHVRNLLENASRPAESDETVEVRGRTSYGDITIHRS